MGGQLCLPLRKNHREAAGLRGDETLEVRLELDTDERTVDIPTELAKALTPALLKKWDVLSFTRKREFCELVREAKKPETRARRIEKIVRELRSS